MCKTAKTCHLFGRWSHLSCSENGNVALTLPQEGQVARGEVILLFSFACGQVKDTVPYPVTSFQHCMDSWKIEKYLKFANTYSQKPQTLHKYIDEVY